MRVILCTRTPNHKIACALRLLRKFLSLTILTFPVEIGPYGGRFIQRITH